MEALRKKQTPHIKKTVQKNEGQHSFQQRSFASKKLRHLKARYKSKSADTAKIHLEFARPATVPLKLS